MSLQEENRVLQGELGRLEDLLAHSRADRDELAIKYSAISERVSNRWEKKRLQTYCMAAYSMFMIVACCSLFKPSMISFLSSVCLGQTRQPRW